MIGNDSVEAEKDVSAPGPQRDNPPSRVCDLDTQLTNRHDVRVDPVLVVVAINREDGHTTAIHARTAESEDCAGATLGGYGITLSEFGDAEIEDIVGAKIVGSKGLGEGVG